MKPDYVNPAPPDYRPSHVGALVEAEGHHPDILLAWARSRITIWTHKIDGITRVISFWRRRRTSSRTDRLGARPWPGRLRALN